MIGGERVPRRPRLLRRASDDLRFLSEALGLPAEAAERLLRADPRPPEPRVFGELVAAARRVLRSEAPALRPRDSAGLPGGLLNLPDLPVVILPDIHARPGFLIAALAWRPPLAAGEARVRKGGAALPSLVELLAAGRATLVCLGDVFHSEGREGALRWNAAVYEYLDSWKESPAMDEEMGRALVCVELILRAKAAFPERFHYLKGNHDNIANEEAHGDHPFYKFAMEGEMAASWFALRYGSDIASDYRSFELDLPVLARGARFVASHAEPAFPLVEEDVVEYRQRPDVVEALTWTPNDGALDGSVAESLFALLGPGSAGARWFGGHRPVEGRYALRQRGLYVQFHRPCHRGLVFLRPGEEPDPACVVVDLEA